MKQGFLRSDWFAGLAISLLVIFLGYIGSFDSNVPAGSYHIQVFLQAGANPADTDTLVRSCEIVWTGAGEVTPTKILTNKTVQDNLTGIIDYYDDDGQTVLLTHTPHDTAATCTKTPD